jgi:ADP-ribose pyrophosphatase YjhB (NUDIX family)
MSRIDHYHSANAPKANSLVPAVSAVVEDERGCVLLHRRRDNNTWSLLGGQLEVGESLSNAVRREVEEESGLDVIVERLIGVYSDPKHVIEYSNGEIRQQFSLCFACKASTGEIRVSDESTEVRFYTREEVSTIDIHPAQVVRLNDYWSNQAGAYVR